MKIQNISLQTMLIIILSVVVITLLSLRSCEKPKPIVADNVNTEPIYITDTLYKGKYDSIIKVKGKVVPPKTVYQWLPGEPQVIDSTSIIEGYLVLHPQGKPPVEIKNEFLTTYTTSPKLLSLNIIKDSLSITTLDPDAIIYTRTHPMFLENYGYNWEDNKLSKYEIKKTPAKVIRKNKLSNFYINGGYDGFLKVPTSGLEYNFIPGRFKVDLDATVLIQQEPKLNLNAKVGYRLF